jgi:hypothetical protein
VTYCYATVTASNVPGATGPTWNAVGRFYVYVWTNWTVTYNCGAGMASACYVCEEVFGKYSADGGATWQNFTDGSNGGTPQTCGSQNNVASYTTTLNAPPGYIFDITFGYDAGVAGQSCGEFGYTVAKQITGLAVPDAPCCGP